MVAPPIPRGSPQAPNYWMYETSGDLAKAVEAYLGAPETMTVREVALMRAYMRQWIESPVWDMNPHADEASCRRLDALRRDVAGVVDVQSLHAWLSRAIDAGIDPL